MTITCYNFLYHTLLKVDTSVENPNNVESTEDDGEFTVAATDGEFHNTSY